MPVPEASSAVNADMEEKCIEMEFFTEQLETFHWS
jgi:hypothetical protein